MFLVDKDKNEAVSVERKTFQELKYKERRHLQEWICKNTEMLGERLLVIQKEFSGFDDTNERLDILAIDETGDLVIIENKLDDTGRDVTWQALKYVSYCSGLTKSDIRDIFQKYLDLQSNPDNAEEVLTEFLGSVDFNEAEINKGDQRIILVAANFRKEVTSSVMWLLDHNVRIKCIKVTPYVLGENVLIDTEQIIPVKDAEDYLIKLAIKKQEEFLTKEKNKSRNTIREVFWAKLLQAMNEKSDLFRNVNPNKESWINCGSGYSGLEYSLSVTGNYGRVELWINRGPKEENKKIFDEILTYKDQIEADFTHRLDWQRLDDGKGCRIAYWLRNVSVFNEDDWDKIIEFMVENMVGFEKAMRDVLQKVMRK